MSIPDRVVPSFRNCTARVEGFEGPFESSNLALSVPAPGPKTHGRGGIQNELLSFLNNINKTPTCLHFQTFLRCRSTSTNIYSALSSCNQRGGNISLLLLRCSRTTGSVQPCSSPDGGRQGLHAGDASVHRHQDLHVGERPGGCHGFRVVAIVYPQVRRARRALPVHGQVEGGGVDPVRLHLGRRRRTED